MVQILPEVPTFGTQLARGFGAGVSKGLETSLPELMKRKIAMREAEASIPEQFRKGVNTGVQPSTADQLRTGKPAEAIQTGTPRSVLSPEQIEAQAAASVRSKNAAAGRPITDFPTELQLAEQRNASNINFQGLQQQAGAQAQETFLRTYPEATPEHLSNISRKAEDLISQGLSPAEVSKQIALEATKFKNTIAGIKNIPGPNRAWTWGSRRSDEKLKEVAKAKVQPLLDQNLFDTARKELSEAGYAPEEVEQVISNLGETTKKNIADFPAIKTIFRNQENPSYRAFSPGSEKQQAFVANLEKTLKEDPSANLLLLRKAYEDRGVDWSSFKDALDDIQAKGGFTANQNQQHGLELLDEPPLGLLALLMHKMNLRGR